MPLPPSQSNTHSVGYSTSSQPYPNQKHFLHGFERIPPPKMECIPEYEPVSHQTAYESSFPFFIVKPTVGFDVGLESACGKPEAANTEFVRSCLRDWYESSPSPARLGQVVAYELMYFKVRDGWNSLGSDGGCDAGPYFCHPFADVTNYNPESGQCLDEVLSA